MRLIRYLILLVLVGAAVFWYVTRPDMVVEADVAGLSGNAIRGEAVFWATGCASCHMAKDAKGDAQLLLSGGQRFVTEFGTFLAPNISSDPEQGIGDWTLLALANAITKGVSPWDTHYYPALPYASYTKLALQDVADLHSFLGTLPASTSPSQPHEVGFPFSWRRILGGWKFLFVSRDWVVAGDLTPPQRRGRYLVEAMAHCGECHTPRNALGGMDKGRWLAGVTDSSGKEVFPNITPAALEWSEPEIVEYLTTGFTPDYDSVGGEMTHVVENMARLPESDRAAIAAYLKLVPPVE